MDRKEILNDIFNNDPLGLLTLKPKPTQRTADDRLLSAFQVILDFYEENSREPEFVKDMQECKLFYELKGLRENEQKIKALKPYDTYGLLDVQAPVPIVPEKREYKSIDDILSDDSFGLLDIDDSIFNLKHVTSPEEREQADFVARRKPCKDFNKFEPLFQQCQKDLKEGNRRLVKFSEDDIKKGSFFVIDGVLAYVSDTYELTKDSNSKIDGRIRCIFENGTVSNLLFRSLGKALYINGQSVTTLLTNTDLIITHIDSEDKESGYIYVLKTKSTNPQVTAIPNLYKIGFSTTTVEERIKNATQDPTYLMADVRIIETYKCYNLNPQKFENIVHSFFGKVCLSIDVHDGKSTRHTPREWFSIPLPIIQQAIALIIKGEISKYRYDEEGEKIYKII